MHYDFNHLKNTNLGYFAHATRILKISFNLIILAIAGVIHAVLPFILVETVSNGIKKTEKYLNLNKNIIN